VSRAVGIDLGTTYTAVAYVDEYGKPVVLKNSDGQTTTPSAVFFDPPNYVVGEVALQSTLTDPDKVVQFVKRFMGVKEHRIHVAGDSYSPEFVSSLILRKVVQEAQDEMGEPVTQAVITVPAYFTESQRHALTKRANWRVCRCCASSTSRPRLRCRMAFRGAASGATCWSMTWAAAPST
jgi:molecular chaperone DnaK